MLDLVIVLGFVLYAVWSGLSARKKASEGLGEYFLAGKTLGGWRAGFSMAATQFAADTPLLVMGLVATGGVFLLWRLWIYGIAFLLMAFVFAVGWRRSGVLTDAQLTEVRYSGRGVLALRVLKSLYYGTLINCVVMAFVLVAAMRVAEVFLPWNVWVPAVHGLFVGLVDALNLASILGTTATGLAPVRRRREQPALDPAHPGVHGPVLHDRRAAGRRGDPTWSSSPWRWWARRSTPGSSSARPAGSAGSPSASRRSTATSARASS